MPDLLHSVPMCLSWRWRSRNLGCLRIVKNKVAVVKPHKLQFFVGVRSAPRAVRDRPGGCGFWFREAGIAAGSCAVTPGPRPRVGLLFPGIGRYWAGPV